LILILVIVGGVDLFTGKEAIVMSSDARDTALPVVASLEHLTGPSRGRVTWLDGSTLDLCLDARRNARVEHAGPEGLCEGHVGRFHRVEDSYQIEAPDDVPVWVNGKRVTTRLLASGDMIEFGEAGPLSRFWIHRDSGPAHKTIPDILSDGVAYLRASRQPPATRTYRAFSGLVRQLTFETTLFFRLVVMVAIVFLAGFAYQQYQVSLRLQQRIASGVERLDSVAIALARTREEALRPSDLAAMREELGQRLISNAERLEALERRSRAIGRVITESLPSIAFLQGSYGFRDRTSELMLRHVVNEDGVPLLSPWGQPMLSLEGDGPVVAINFLGTGFFIGDQGALITNRHVAIPWGGSAGDGMFAADNLEPIMMKFVVYLPGEAEAAPVALLLASEQADLAILRRIGDFPPHSGLELAAGPPAPGDEVIVMGYPTGLRSMLAQSGKEFIEDLEETSNTGFWDVAVRLAKAGHIVPLASRGIVGQISPAAIVYDAETTHGGSGGPVLDMSGKVIAVNAAILPEYGGSNIGVPAARVLELLEEAGIR
jgi:serine protease Do